MIDSAGIVELAGPFDPQYLAAWLLLKPPEARNRIDILASIGGGITTLRELIFENKNIDVGGRQPSIAERSCVNVELPNKTKYLRAKKALSHPLPYRCRGGSFNQHPCMKIWRQN
jgi:hypothetical protein